MNFSEVTLESFQKVKARPVRIGKTQKLINSFLNSGQQVALVTGWKKDYKNINNAYATLRQCCSNKGIEDCKIVRRGGNLYMVNKKLVEEI